jgi:hypothetical protein
MSAGGEDEADDDSGGDDAVFSRRIAGEHPAARFPAPAEAGVGEWRFSISPDATQGLGAALADSHPYDGYSRLPRNRHGKGPVA